MPEGMVGDTETSMKCCNTVTVNLMSIMATKNRTVVYTVQRLDKGVTHIPGWTEQKGGKHHATHNSAQLKLNELFISKIFHLTF